jgi:hypothetical protein
MGKQLEEFNKKAKESAGTSGGIYQLNQLDRFVGQELVLEKKRIFEILLLGRVAIFIALKDVEITVLRHSLRGFGIFARATVEIA